MKNLKNVFTKGISTALLVSMLGSGVMSCVDPGNTLDDTTPPGGGTVQPGGGDTEITDPGDLGDPGDPGNPLATYRALNAMVDIDFPMGSNLNQTSVRGILTNNRSILSGHAQEIGNTSWGTPDYFYDTVRTDENAIMMGISYESSANQMVNIYDYRYTNLVTALSDYRLFDGSSTAANLYQAQLNAFMKASYVNQRQFMGTSMATHYSELNALKAGIGNVTVPSVGQTVKVGTQEIVITSEAQALVIALRDRLIENMPNGAKANNTGTEILQQLEDWG